MAHAWAIYRDEIVFDDAFRLEVLDEIACRGGAGAQPTPIPVGTTVILAARAYRLERISARGETLGNPTQRLLATTGSSSPTRLISEDGRSI